MFLESVKSFLNYEIEWIALRRQVEQVGKDIGVCKERIFLDQNLPEQVRDWTQRTHLHDLPFEVANNVFGDATLGAILQNSCALKQGEGFQIYVNLCCQTGEESALKDRELKLIAVIARTGSEVWQIGWSNWGDFRLV